MTSFKVDYPNKADYSNKVDHSNNFDDCRGDASSLFDQLGVKSFPAFAVYSAGPVDSADPVDWAGPVDFAEVDGVTTGDAADCSR